jgi:F0F1-type ATP synthase membrane subunit b/b'
MPVVAYVAAGDVVAVQLPRADTTTTTVAGETASGGEATTTETPVKDPSPLTVAPKELLWSLGSFLVLLALMRLVFYPKLHGGMTARQDHVAKRLADADAAKAAAQSEVAEYEAQLAALRGEGQAKVDAANRTIESERAAKLAEANAAIAQQRAAANAEVDAAKAAVAGSVAEAARDVVTNAAQRVLGQAPDAGAVAAAVDAAMSAGVGR